MQTSACFRGDSFRGWHLPWELPWDFGPYLWWLGQGHILGSTVRTNRLASRAVEAREQARRVVHRAERDITDRVVGGARWVARLPGAAFRWADRKADQLKKWALDQWNRIWSRLTEAVRAVRSARSTAVARTYARVLERAARIGYTVGRYVINAGRAAVRFVTNQVRALSGFYPMFADAVAHPSHLLDFVLPPRDDYGAPRPDPKIGKGEAKTIWSRSERMDFEGTVLVSAEATISFTTRKQHAEDGTEWFEVDITQDGGLGIAGGEGAGAGTKKKGAGEGFTLEGSLHQAHTVTYRFRTQAEADAFIAHTKRQYRYESGKLLRLMIPGAGWALYMADPARSIFDVAEDLEGRPVTDSDEWYEEGEAKAEAKEGAFSASGTANFRAGVTLEDGNEKLYVERGASGALAADLGFVEGDLAGRVKGRLTLDPGDPTTLTASGSIRVTQSTDLVWLEAVGLDAKDIERIKGKLTTSSTDGLDLRIETKKIVSSEDVARLTDAMRHGDTRAIAAIVAASARTTFDVELWDVQDTETSFSAHGAAGLKAGIDAGSSTSTDTLVDEFHVTVF